MPSLPVESLPQDLPSLMSMWPLENFMPGLLGGISFWDMSVQRALQLALGETIRAILS